MKNRNWIIYAVALVCCLILVYSIFDMVGLVLDETAPSTEATLAEPSVGTQPTEPSTQATTLPTVDLGPAVNEDGSFAWTLYGSSIWADGSTLKSLDTFTVAGQLPSAEDESDTLQIEIVTPENYKMNFNSGVGDYLVLNNNLDQPYIVSGTYTYDGFCRFALSTEKGYVIMKWEGSKTFLLGSRDPNVTPQEILSYFQNFVDSYSK